MTLSDTEVQRLRAQVAAKPKPIWQEFYCARCDHPFKAPGVADVCAPCSVPSLRIGLKPLTGGTSGT